MNKPELCLDSLIYRTEGFTLEEATEKDKQMIRDSRSGNETPPYEDLRCQVPGCEVKCTIVGLVGKLTIMDWDSGAVRPPCKSTMPKNLLPGD